MKNALPLALAIVARGVAGIVWGTFRPERAEALAAARPGTIAAATAADHVGQSVTVEGIVAQVPIAERATFIDIRTSYPDEDFVGGKAKRSTSAARFSFIAGSPKSFCDLRARSESSEPASRCCNKSICGGVRFAFAQRFDFRSNYFRAGSKFGLHPSIKRHTNFVIPQICAQRPPIADALCGTRFGAN
jgi:hypothetical protein